MKNRANFVANDGSEIVKVDDHEIPINYSLDLLSIYYSTIRLIKMTDQDGMEHGASLLCVF